MRTSAFLLTPSSPTLALIVVIIALPAGAETCSLRNRFDMIEEAMPINRPNGPVGDPPRARRRLQPAQGSVRLRRRWRRWWRWRIIVAGGGVAARRPPRDAGIAHRRERLADTRLRFRNQLNSCLPVPCRA